MNGRDLYAEYRPVPACPPPLSSCRLAPQFTRCDKHEPRSAAIGVRIELREVLYRPNALVGNEHLHTLRVPILTGIDRRPQKWLSAGSGHLERSRRQECLDTSRVQ